MLEILITATRRPDILDRTLRSFKMHLFRNWPCRVILNVDPVGPGTSHDVISVVNEYFLIKTINLPETAHFGRAFKWTWSQAEADFCFNLEDDWELLRPVSLTTMLEVMVEYPSLATLRLPFRPVGRIASKNWKFFYQWIDVKLSTGKYGFFQCPARDRAEIGFCGHPSLVRGEFVKRAAKLLDPKLNPEKQFHGGNPALLEEVLKWQYGVSGPQNQPEAIRDIGREWMQNNGLRKKGNKAWFSEWEDSHE